MRRIVHCVKLDREAEGLDAPPFPGGLGERIYEQISQEVWNEWIEIQTRLFNEHRIAGNDTEGRKFLMEQMERYLFGEEEGDLSVSFTLPARKE